MARLIGKRKSVASSRAGLSVKARSSSSGVTDKSPGLLGDAESPGCRNRRGGGIDGRRAGTSSNGSGCAATRVELAADGLVRPGAGDPGFRGERKYAVKSVGLSRLTGSSGRAFRSAARSSLAGEPAAAEFACAAGGWAGHGGVSNEHSSTNATPIARRLGRTIDGPPNKARDRLRSPGS